jgi:hypothetical protein
MIYSAKIAAMNALISYLTDHYSQGKPEVLPSNGHKVFVLTQG